MLPVQVDARRKIGNWTAKSPSEHPPSPCTPIYILYVCTYEIKSASNITGHQLHSSQQFCLLDDSQLRVPGRAKQIESKLCALPPTHITSPDLLLLSNVTCAQPLIPS